MPSNLEKTLFLLTKEIEQQSVNSKLFLEYMENLTDANKSISNTHDLLIPIIQDFSEYITTLPELMNDIVMMTEDIKLFLHNASKRAIEIDNKLAKILEEIKNG